MDAMCRNEFGYHPVNTYLNITCAMCYIYTFHSTHQFDYPLMYAEGGFLVGGEKNASIYYLPTAFNRSSAVYFVAFPTDGIEHDALLWQDCCQAAADCCAAQIKAWNETEQAEEEHHMCPMTWDGWQCWDRTKKGQTVTGSCPRYINPVSSPICSAGTAEKTCTEAGEWFRLLESTEDTALDGNFSKEWTNYTSCFNLTPLEHRYQMQVASYCISIFFLIPAILIFWRCKQLHVQRNMIHLNFFLSLIIYAIMLIISQSVFTHQLFEDPEILVTDFSGTIECRVIYGLTMYLRLANYFWMFCEGLFLLRHLKHVFLREQRFYLYLIGGWGFPAIPVAIYIGLRSSDSGCWMEPKDDLEWILKGPALFTLALNFIFLWYIVCLLLKKLQTRYVSEVEKFRKSCRAVLVLLPLFGLHFLLTAYRPAASCGLQWYFLLNVALDGLQGFFVSMTFCYSNSEVIALAKRAFQLYRTRRSLLHRTVSGRSAGSNSSNGTRTSDTIPVRSVSTVTRSSILLDNLAGSRKTSRARKPGRVQTCRFESIVDSHEPAESRGLLRLKSRILP